MLTYIDQNLSPSFSSSNAPACYNDEIPLGETTATSYQTGADFWPRVMM